MKNLKYFLLLVVPLLLCETVLFNFPRSKNICMIYILSDICNQYPILTKVKSDILTLVCLSAVSGLYYLILLRIAIYQRKMNNNLILPPRKMDMLLPLLAFIFSIPIMLFLYNFDLIEFDDIFHNKIIMGACLMISSFIPCLIYSIIFYNIIFSTSKSGH